MLLSQAQRTADRVSVPRPGPPGLQQQLPAEVRPPPGRALLHVHHGAAPLLADRVHPAGEAAAALRALPGGRGFAAQVFGKQMWAWLPAGAAAELPEGSCDSVHPRVDMNGVSDTERCQAFSGPGRRGVITF